MNSRRVELVLSELENCFEQAELAYGHGMSSALDEAAHLIAFVISDEPTLTERHMGLEITEKQQHKLDELVTQRINLRRPAAYLTGWAWFAGVPFEVDRRAIIPRSPIAELLVDGFAPWVEADQVTSILDMCAGTGCIAMVAAMVFADAQVDAAELSPKALELALQNRTRLGLQERVRLVESDLYSALKNGQYDLIISNPPYVPALRQMPAEYGHEPAMALFAGDDGLDLALPILAGAIDHLRPGGWLVLEVGEAQQALMDVLPELPAIWMEFEWGGEGVMMISRSDLQTCESRLRSLASQRALHD
ncbi:MAG: 50S ribosomal protein L3 N(5)-glutamine methyltransferase [Immundisolibacteraceae bacterium]|nr:50S ribosomal protein L3 N(5)-glutamine methyltransferase [Immundisolibacteraceae bacterium]